MLASGSSVCSCTVASCLALTLGQRRLWKTISQFNFRKRTQGATQKLHPVPWWRRATQTWKRDEERNDWRTDGLMVGAVLGGFVKQIQKGRGADGCSLLSFVAVINDEEEEECLLCCSTEQSAGWKDLEAPWVPETDWSNSVYSAVKQPVSTVNNKLNTPLWRYNRSVWWLKLIHVSFQSNIFRGSIVLLLSTLFWLWSLIWVSPVVCVHHSLQWLQCGDVVLFTIRNNGHTGILH